MKRNKLVVIGYINIDEDIFPSGEVVQHIGGGGFFAAKSATNLLGSENVVLVSKVGKDFDFTRLEDMNTQGIHRSLAPTSRCIQRYFQSKEGERREIQQLAGASQRLNAAELGSALPSGTTWVHIATMPPLQQRAFVKRVRKIAPKAIVSLDSDLFLFKDERNLQQIKENFVLADVVFMNRAEWEKIKDSEKDFCDRFSWLVVKKDKDGAVCYQAGKRILQVDAPKVTGTNFTGAGDTFAGAYASWFVLNALPLHISLNLESKGEQVSRQRKLGQQLSVSEHRQALDQAVRTASSFVAG